MKKTLVLIFILIGLCHVAWAQSLQDKRRVEEGKRQDLKLSEYYFPQDGPPIVEAENTDPDTYFKQLFSKEAAGVSDAYRTLVILLGVDDQYPNTEAQFQYLKKEGIIPKSLRDETDFKAPLRKGALAFMYLKALNIKGGITLRIFGVHQRYALAELIYQDIMIPGIVHDIVSGQELIFTLTQSADYLAGQQKDAP